MANKAQDLACTLCGHRWLGVSTTCPNCQGVAKSEGEMTKKIMEEPDLKKGLK